jgi:hypothetical protein
MHLVQPSFLITDASVPDFAIRAYAQVLCEDFARWSRVPAPRVVVTGQIPFDAHPCQSPSSAWASVVNAELFVASGVSNALQLQFVIAHALMHQVPNLVEWECDLPALDWMNCRDLPIVESTARAIAQTCSWRARAMQFLSGQRAVTIGDALTSQVWDSPILRVL